MFIPLSAKLEAMDKWRAQWKSLAPKPDMEIHVECATCTRKAHATWKSLENKGWLLSITTASMIIYPKLVGTRTYWCSVSCMENHTRLQECGLDARQHFDEATRSYLYPLPTCNAPGGET